MALTSPWQKKRLRALVMVAVSSGRRSSFGEVVLVNLLASREKEQAHEFRAQGRREVSPRHPRSFVMQAGKQLRARTRARGGVRCCGRWQGRS